jgi:bacterioferritin-associated ferredoxin
MLASAPKQNLQPQKLSPHISISKGLDSSTGSNPRVDFGVPTPGHVAHNFSRIPIQPKLTVNTPGDIYEQEAERVAAQVMRTPEPQLQRACACGGDCAKCQTEQLSQEPQLVQTKSLHSTVSAQTAAPPIVHEVLASPGQPLDPATRAFMEPRFGHDFSNVRVHTDDVAEQSTQEVNALAYTAGRNVVFAANRYAPQTDEGRRLLAHELTHVIQQSTTSASPPGSGLLQRQPRGELRQRAEALHAADARTLLEGSLPFVLEQMTEEQIRKMQRVLDAAVVNPEVSKKADALYKRSLIGYVGSQPVQDEAIVRRGDQAMRSFTHLTEADYRIALDYKPLLTPDALQPTTDNPDEVTALESIRLTLQSWGVWLQFNQPYVTDPDDPSNKIHDPRIFRAWLTLGPKVNNEIPTDTGRLDRRSLLRTTVLGSSFYRNFHEGPVQSGLNRESHRLLNSIETGLAQHNLLARIRRKAFVGVTEASDWLGGADFPDTSIWDQPHEFVRQALVANVGGNVRLAAAYLYQAAYLTHYAARLVAEYIDDSTSGAERAVAVLTVAKKVGEVAEIGLTIMDGAAILKGGVNLVRGARETAEIGGAVAERVAGRHVAESPAVAGDLGKVRSLSESRPVAQAAIRAGEKQLVKASEKEVAAEVEKRAVRYVDEHPNVVHGEPGKRRAPIGEEDHEIVEVVDRSSPMGIGCEYHSQRGPKVPCPENMGWTFKPDRDFHVKTHDEAVAKAFEETGVPLKEFQPTKVAKTKDGKTITVEWEVKTGPNKGAKVNIDDPTILPPNKGPQAPHVGYEVPGKRYRGEGRRGHVFPAEGVLATRPAL